jgi:hypothetical protein
MIADDADAVARAAGCEAYHAALWLDYEGVFGGPDGKLRPWGELLYRVWGAPLDPAWVAEQLALKGKPCSY